MAEEPTNIIIGMLRRQDVRFNRIEEKLDRVIDDLHDVKVRLTSVERIEKRLDLVGPAGFAE